MTLFAEVRIHIRPRFVPALLLSLLNCCGCLRYDPPSDIIPASIVAERPPSISIKDDVCTCVIPVATTKAPLSWGVDWQSSCEYSIQLEIVAKESKYEFGFTFFSTGGPKCTGTFAELLAAGESDIWQIDKDSGTNIGDIDATTDGKNLTFTLTDKKNLDLLFASKPRIAVLKTGGTLLKQRQYSVPIAYETEIEGK